MAFDSSLDESFAITQIMQIGNMISNATSKVKRPLNAFNLYFMERKQIEKELNPKVSGNEISRIIGEKWSQMSKEEKSPYIERAKTLKYQFKQMHPNYHYQKTTVKQKKNPILHESTDIFKLGDSNLVQQSFSQDSIETQIKNMFYSLGHATIMRFLAQNKSEAEGIVHNFLQVPGNLLS